MKKNDTENKGKKIKELFVQDLARIEGGSGATTQKTPRGDCPQFTTMACGEEAEGCGGNC